VKTLREYRVGRLRSYLGLGGVAHALHGGRLFEGTADIGLGASVKVAHNLNQRFSEIRFRHRRAVQGNPRSVLVRRNEVVGL